MTYKAQSAQDAQEFNYGGKSYWDYLERTAQEHYDYWMARGETERANEQFVRSLSEAIRRPAGYNEI